jgi:hypothetical protein
MKIVVMMREADGETLVGLLFLNLRAKCLLLEVCVTSTNTIQFVQVFVRHFKILQRHELETGYSV